MRLHLSVLLACACVILANTGRVAADEKGKITIDVWDQCGGKSGCGKDGKVCEDKAWSGFKCARGSKCVRQDEYYWGCQAKGSGSSNSNKNNNNSGGSNNNNNNNGGGSAAPSKPSKPQPNKQLKVQGDGDYDYGVPLQLSNWFYRAQRSGFLPKDNGVFWRGSAGTYHKYKGRDVTGGWYDAGDNVKFNFPMAWTAGVMAWGVYEFRDGFEKTDALQGTLNNLKWATDYFLKCIISDTEVVGQVGNGQADHAMWTRPEDIEGPVPVYAITAEAPGSDLAGAMGAALAASHLVFKKDNPEYAEKLLEGAKTLYKFGKTYRGFYSTSIADAGSFYKSSNFYDDLSFCACWLYMATGEKSYLEDAIEFFDLHWKTENGAMVWNNFDWDSNSWGAVVLLSRLNPGNPFYKQRMEQFIKDWTPETAGPWVKYTPKGCAFTGNWGSLRHTGNGVFLMKAYMNKIDDGRKDKTVDCIGHQQLRYIMGDPKLSGRSYIVGFGKNSPQQPHHRAASCPPMPAPCDYNSGFNNPGANPHVLYGAIVGGPDGADVYDDSRNNFIQNEVAVDYNGGFHGALAAMTVAKTKWSQC